MGILDNAKEVAKAVQEIHNLELYQRVLNLHSDIIDIVEENNRLRAKNQELFEILQTQKQMSFTEPFYWQEGDKTPYCAARWESHRKSIHVVMKHDEDSYTRWECPSCKHNYRIDKGIPRATHRTNRPPSQWG
jgi:hypothetical protein